MKKSRIVFGVLRLPIDFAATLAAFYLAYYIRPITDLIPGVQFNFFPELLPNFQEYSGFGLYAAAFLVIIFIVNGMYSLKKSERLGRMIFRVFFLVSTWLMFIIAYYFLIVHQLFFSRIALAHIWFFTIIFVMAGRFTMRLIESIFLRYGIGQRRVLFVGVNAFAEECGSRLMLDRRYKVLGAIAPILATDHTSLKILGTPEKLEAIVKKYAVEEIIHTDPEMAGISSSDLLGFCKANQISYYFAPDLFRLQSANVEMEMVEKVPLITLKQTPLEGWGAIIKRLFDIISSIFLIVALLPLWIILGIIIKMDSPGPVFYGSRRKYRDRVFKAYKFRSMIQEAEQIKADLMAKNERKGPLFKIKDDPRITKVGRFLRKTSLDELPQLFNVLMGSMSLVGPRPHLPEEVDQYKKHHYQVFAIKPGLTGLAQISGRSSLDFEDEIKLDFYYIENWSLFMDIKIILKSVLVIFRADGC